MSASEKQHEAEKLMSSVKKALTSSSLSRSKRLSAAETCEKAARLYMQVSNSAMAQMAFQHAADQYARANEEASAARCWQSLANYLYDQASTTSDGAEMQGTLQLQAAECYAKSAELYHIGGEGGREAAALTTAAEYARKVATTSARKTGTAATTTTHTGGAEYLTAADVMYKRLAGAAIAAFETIWESDLSKLYQLPEVYHQLVLYHLRNNDIVDAVQVLKREVGLVASGPGDGTYDPAKNLFRALNQPANAAKAGLEIVVLCLSCKGDVSWAKAELGRLRSVDGFAQSSEEQTAAALIAAYEERDEEQLKDILTHHSTLRFLKAEVARLAKRLNVDDSTKGGKTVAPGAMTEKTVETAAQPSAAAALFTRKTTTQKEDNEAQQVSAAVVEGVKEVSSSTTTAGPATGAVETTARTVEEEEDEMDLR